MPKTFKTISLELKKVCFFTKDSFWAKKVHFQLKRYSFDLKESIFAYKKLHFQLPCLLSELKKVCFVCKVAFWVIHTFSIKKDRLRSEKVILLEKVSFSIENVPCSLKGHLFRVEKVRSQQCFIFSWRKFMLP